MRFVARSFNMQRKLPRSLWSLLLWAVDHLTGWWQWWDYLSLVRFIFTSVTKMSRRLKWLSCWKRWRRVFHRLLFLVKWEACKVSFTWIVLEIKNSGKPRKWKNLGLFDTLIRELTSLQSFQPLIDVLFIPKTSLKKVNSCCFKLLRAYSIYFVYFVKCWQMFLELNSKGLYKKV